ncbi:MAG TPA: DUF488 domain-containing protein [Candidatus Nocardiopsis merdipullorum]|nr:DUF488 domain-containing protein [Candidatus Nocardiopsis merdipullorum]
MSTDAARTGVFSAPLFETHGVVGVGYERLSIDGFLAKLREEQVSLLVDVRLDPVSRKPGLSKNTLAANLKSVGISYVHAPALGNPEGDRPGFAGSGSELRASRKKYADMITTDDASEWIDRIAEEASDKVVALLCFEGNEARCHRHVVLQKVRERMEHRSLA